MTFYDDPNREVVGLLPIWGGDSTDNVPNATGATAGSPGTWTPAGADAPADAAEASSWGVVASPATAWTTGQYVQGRTAGAPGEVTWSGTSWVGGRAPLDEPTTDSLPGSPASFTIPQVQDWVDAHPHLAADVLAHEQARGADARTTLLDWLRGFVESHDGVDQP